MKRDEEMTGAQRPATENTDTNHISLPDRTGSTKSENKREEGGPVTEKAIDSIRLTEEETALPAGHPNSIRSYLAEISRIPLLAKEDEWQLAQIIVRGKEAEQRLHEAKANNELTLSQTEMEVLQGVVEQSEEARNKLILSNLRLVVHIAKGYRNRGISFLDLIQEGNLGLMKAVEKFDHTLGFKFSTYATWWIRQAITRAIADYSQTIRIPVQMLETARELKRIKQEYLHTHGTPPSLEMLSQLTEMPIMKIKKVENIFEYTTSLERPLSDEGDETISDMIADEFSLSPTKETFRLCMTEELDRALDYLDEREKMILKLRYGLEDGHPRTLRDVSNVFNLTRERVRQIEIRAIEKLKHPARKEDLQQFRDLLSCEE
ncbi:sigma-70 family RNA polymerase sigma factor [Candidatus Acetothermia bacterium]|nr:sigma-70 family RNA polymerase sigma factor [Candidatus Acetothermia bacterium]